MRILIIDDEASYREALGYILQREGFEVAEAADGRGGLAEFEHRGADLVLLDLMMPGLAGTEVCREIRRRSSVPIIMLTARDSEVDKVVGLELGADDYVTKPFSHRELVARIRAVLRRGADDPAPPGVVAVGGIRVDVDRQEVTRAREEGKVAKGEGESAMLAGSSPEANSSTGYGAPTTSATPRPWTCTSRGCAPRSNPIHPTPDGSAQCVVWATSSTTGDDPAAPAPRSSGAIQPKRPVM